MAPILLGSYLQSAFPGAVKLVTPFAPLFAVLASSLLACRFYLLLYMSVEFNYCTMLLLLFYFVWTQCFLRECCSPQIYGGQCIIDFGYVSNATCSSTLNQRTRGCITFCAVSTFFGFLCGVSVDVKLICR